MHGGGYLVMHPYSAYHVFAGNGTQFLQAAANALQYIAKCCWPLSTVLRVVICSRVIGRRQGIRGFIHLVF